MTAITPSGPPEGPKEPGWGRSEAKTVGSDVTVSFTADERPRSVALACEGLVDGDVAAEPVPAPPAETVVDPTTPPARMDNVWDEPDAAAAPSTVRGPLADGPARGGVAATRSTRAVDAAGPGAGGGSGDVAGKRAESVDLSRSNGATVDALSALAVEEVAVRADVPEEDGAVCR